VVHSNIKTVFQFSEFNDFIIGRFLFVVALRMLSTLIGWWLYEITGSVFFIGLVGLAEILPSIALSLYAGYVIDISEKRLLLLRCVLLFGLCVLSLLGLSIALLQNPASKTLIIVSIYLIIFIMGCIRAFLSPIFNAILPSVVERDYLPKATAYSSATWLFGSIFGHAIAGFSIAYLGLIASFAIIAALTFGSFSILYLLLPKPASVEKVDTMIKNWQQIKIGMQFVISNKIILGALSLDLFAVFFGGIVAIIPVIAVEVLKVGPIGFAWLNMSTDLGSALMLVILMFLPINKKQGLKLFVTIAIFGVSIIIFSYSRSLILSCVALFISGLADTINSVIRGTIIQIQTPNKIRGRVMGINSLFTNSSNELGKLESGIAAHVLGTMPSVLFGGIMTLIIVAVSYIKSPSLRKLEY
jgi:MFS family permease